jgi:hypothetical protein
MKRLGEVMIMEETPLNSCIICGQPKAEGILIMSELICDDCEKEIVQTDVQDSRYPYFVSQMKQVFYTIQA